MTKQALFNSAHAAAKRTFADQARKHVSARMTYAAIFAVCLRGAYLAAAPVVAVPAKPSFMFLRGL